MKSANAILVNWLGFEKIAIDFSNADSIENAIGAKRLSTIHTTKTQELSRQLGVHLIGFVDRNGNDTNNGKAAELSGYEYIGSKLLLCKTDDRYNPLPFTEDELETVYTYLDSGKIIPIRRADCSFLDKLGIVPQLPNLGIEPKILVSEKYPDIAAFVYDLKGADMMVIGGELFNYSDLLINRFSQVSDCLLSPDKDYYLASAWYGNRDYYAVLVEPALSKEGPHIIDANKILEDLLKQSSDIDPEESQEEAYETIENRANLSGMEDYYVLIGVDVEWPDSKNSRRRKACFAYPLWYYEFDQLITVPDFPDLLEVTGFDELDDKAVLKVTLGDEEVEELVGLNKETTIKVNCVMPNGSHPVGEITLSLKKARLYGDEIKGEILLSRSLLQKKGGKETEIKREENVIIMPRSDDGVDRMVDLGLEVFFLSDLVSVDQDLAILRITDGEIEYFGAVSEDEPYVEETDYIDQEGRKRVIITATLKRD